MSTKLHSQASVGARHPLHKYEYANAAARTSATGFVSTDLYTVAKQTDNDSLWLLTSTAPLWKEIVTSPTGSFNPNSVIYADVVGSLTDDGSNFTYGSQTLTLGGTSSKVVLESNTQTSGNVVSIKSTPGSASTARVMVLQAEGTNWGSGSHLLELISDDISCNPITINDGSSDRAWITQLGEIHTVSDLNLRSGTATIKSLSNTNIRVIPNGTGHAIIGSGSSSHSFNDPGDLLVSNRLEVDGITYLDGSVIMSSNASFAFGSGASSGVNLRTNTAIVQDTFELAVPDNYGRIFHLIDRDNLGNDYGQGLKSNPTLIIQSSTAAATATDEWISISHDQTDGVIDCGTGTLNLGGTANVNFAGATRTASTVTHDAYVELEIAGTLYKFMLGS
jgi:hypothetical protein